MVCVFVFRIMQSGISGLVRRALAPFPCAPGENRKPEMLIFKLSFAPL